MVDPTDKYKALVARLLNGTKANTVSWDVDMFRGDIFTHQGGYKIVIGSGEDGEGAPFISIEVKDARGRVIDSFTDNDLSKGIWLVDGYANSWLAMSELLHMARREAYGADEALDDILKALDDSKHEDEA